MAEDIKTDLQLVNEAWKKAKKERKLTQKDVAIAMGFKHQSSFSSMLSGVNVPLDIDAVLKLSVILQCSPLELAPGVIGPYADAIHALVKDVQDQQESKDEIIADLERRLADVGISPRQQHLLDLLTQLPVHETEMLINQVQARVDFMRGQPVMKYTGKAVKADITPTPVTTLQTDRGKAPSGHPED